ncbi:hypothetical protein NMG60_11008779 [Bertholletia excelsa]
MSGCECFCWNRRSEDYDPLQPQPFSLPSPIPEWPPGRGFATGKICLGEIEVVAITKFERICNLTPLHGKSKGVTFYRPEEIPDGFCILGHYCQPEDEPLRGYLLVAREVTTTGHCHCDSKSFSPALIRPIGYELICSTDSHRGGCGYIWLPKTPSGYKAMGFVVTDKPDEPGLDDIRCVRADLTETCEVVDMILESDSIFSKDFFKIYNMRPRKRGMLGKGVAVGTFWCTSYHSNGDELDIACLKNLDSTLYAMPNLDQIHALVNHYGPTIFFHPDEVYMPSSVPWFFKNGALLCRPGKVMGEPIDSRGSNLPCGGKNDGEYWIDLPVGDEERNYLKCGNIESAELYVHVKPALGGTFTDIVMWVFCPFNGPATLKVGLMNIKLDKIGEHVSDWEHFTLRLSNFNGELWSVYFSQHSGGEWVNVSDLEFIEGNKAIVYSSNVVMQVSHILGATFRGLQCLG